MALILAQDLRAFPDAEKLRDQVSPQQRRIFDLAQKINKDASYSELSAIVDQMDRLGDEHEKRVRIGVSWTMSSSTTSRTTGT